MSVDDLRSATGRPHAPARTTTSAGPVPRWCPLTLTVSTIARFVNAELADHPVYDGIEVQWFDDATHGTGMLVFLSRREDGRVDYYRDPALTVDPAGYAIGGGTGHWGTTTFAASHLEVDDHGVRLHVAFTDVDGRHVEMIADDRDAGRRRPGQLLAPFGAEVRDPRSLLLVWLEGFDLLRRGAVAPVVRIDGVEVATGQLPGAALHGRHLIKAAAPLTVVAVCPDHTGPVPIEPTATGPVELDATGTAIAAVLARGDGAEARLALDPPLPDLELLPEGRPCTGRWTVAVAGQTLTGGRWHARRDGAVVALGLDVTDRWDPPAGLPPLLRVVTRLVPVFRRWPTTYRWRARVVLGRTPHLTGAWERTGRHRGNGYRRVTRS